MLYHLQLTVHFTNLPSVCHISNIYDQQHDDKPKNNSMSKVSEKRQFCTFENRQRKVNLNSEAQERRQISYLDSFLTGMYQLFFCMLE